MKLQTAVFFAAFCAVGLLSVAAVQPAPISIATVPVGDPGNAADVNDGDSDTSGNQHFGSVPYYYNLGKYDVTLTQYTAFLNAVAASDPHSLYDPYMATELNIAGISRSGSSGSYSYAVIGDGQRPVTHVSWYDAVRFCNWLTNGQGSGGTETGVYTLTGLNAMSGPLPADHSALVGAGTKWFLPTQNEWYKAAYYKGGSTNAGYWAYPFQSNTQPTANQVPGGSNSANFLPSNGPFTGVWATTQSMTYSPNQNYLTPVGAYVSAKSPYGSFDMGGEVFQWTETMTDSFNNSAVNRGSNFASSGVDMVQYIKNVSSAYEDGAAGGTGFRVAMVTPLPEPSSIALFALGMIGVAAIARRRKL